MTSTSPRILSPKREFWLLITLAGIQFTHILDFMIMMPLGPQFTQIFAITDAQFGLLVSAYTLAAGASGLLAATYLDKFDRKKLLLTLYILFGLATLACGLAPTYYSLMVARVLAGVFGGVLSALSQTIIADVIPFERRGRAMGIVMTSFSLSTVAGVPLGLFLAAHFSWHAPFFGIAALVGLLATGAFVTLPPLVEHLKMKNRPSAWSGIKQVLADANHMKAFAFSGLLMFAGFTVIPFITIYLQTNVGWRTDQVPYVYLCGGVVTLFTARLVGVVIQARLLGPDMDILEVTTLIFRATDGGTRSRCRGPASFPQNHGFAWELGQAGLHLIVNNKGMVTGIFGSFLFPPWVHMPNDTVHGIDKIITSCEPIRIGLSCADNNSHRHRCFYLF